MKIAFITNSPSHYRIKLFEKLAKRYDIDFLFFSDKKERYRERKHPQRNGKFKSHFLKGCQIGNTRITPGIIPRLLTGGYDVIIKCINGKFALAATFLTAKLLRKKFILWTGIWYHPENFIHRLTFKFTRYIYSHSDAIVVYGAHVRDYLTSNGVSGHKIFIGWNTVDNHLFKKPLPADEKQEIMNALSLNGEKVVLYVGRLVKEKGIDYLLEAYEKVQKKLDCALIIIGSGAMEDNFRQYCREQHLGKVHFLGYVENTELYKYYGVADLFVLPSVTTKMFKEPWGLVINEAMNQGCPVIATDAVGAAVGGLLDQNVNGFIIPEKNVNEIYDKLILLLTNKSIQNFFAKNALKKIKSWDYERMSTGFINAIKYVNIEQK